MSNERQVEVVTAQWVLMNQIYVAVIAKVDTFNVNKDHLQKLTVTARVHHGVAFDVYSQPIEASTARRTQVKWISPNHIIVTRYVGPEEHQPDSTEMLEIYTNSGGEKTLRNRKVEDIASQIVGQSK